MKIKFFIYLLFALAFSLPLQARLDRVEIEHHSHILDGKNYGVVGPYEQFIGTMYFSIDPNLRPNQIGRAHV